MSAVSTTYLGIPGIVLFWGVTALALVLSSHRIYQLWRYMSLGKKSGVFPQMIKRALYTARVVLTQWCQLKNLTLGDRASVGHAFMFWGFFTFVIFYFIFIILGAGFGLSESLENTSFFFYYTWVMDIMAVLVITGAAWGIVRRYIVVPERLKTERTFEAAVILVTVLIHPMTHLFKEATSIALGHPPFGQGSALPPISSVLSNFFSGSPAASIESLNIWFFWAHWLTVLFVLVLIPYTRYCHMLASIFNILFRSPPPKGALQPVNIETVEHFGLSRITDLSWKQGLDLYSCVKCNNCQVQCPATASGKPLNPRKVIQDLKSQLLSTAPKLLKAKDKTEAAIISPDNSIAGKVLPQDEIWNCTTCRACDEICPVWVDHVDKIIDARRNLVMEQAIVPETAENALNSLESRGHPWRGTAFTRTDWAEDLHIKTMADDKNVDVLFWVGCTEALEERSIKVAQAIAKLLKVAGVNFGILGGEETCCGDPARRMGNEYLYQMQAQNNIELFRNYGIKKIVTGCPHCYNNIKNEYPQFGGNFEVIHHTELLASLISEGKLELLKVNAGLITYHDPCYLGRYNDIYDWPRRILSSLTNFRLVEMENNRKRSFCCGAGGGHLWLEEQRAGQRINVMRTEQAMVIKADVVATACPYCLQMLEDGAKTQGVEEKLKVKDIAELLVKSLK